MKGQRILAIDHGSKRIGFALSDEFGWTAQPLETFYRRNPDADIRHIQDLVREHEVGQVLVGMPLRLAVSASLSTAYRLGLPANRAINP